MENKNIENELFFDFCKNNNKESFDKLYYKVKPWLFKMIYRMVGNKNVAEDLFQETWAIVIAKRNNFDFEKGKFTNYIFTIARNEIIQLLNKNNIVKKFHIEQNDFLNRSTNIQDIEKEYELKEEANELQRAILNLPDKYKNVIIKYHFCEFSYKDIADECNLKVGTVKTWMNRGKKILEKKLIHICV